MRGARGEDEDEHAAPGTSAAGDESATSGEDEALVLLREIRDELIALRDRDTQQDGDS